jgi:hypothetical protein
LTFSLCLGLAIEAVISFSAVSGNVIFVHMLRDYRPMQTARLSQFIPALLRRETCLVFI